jgi:hypothetical protein
VGGRSVREPKRDDAKEFLQVRIIPIDTGINAAKSGQLT